MNVPGSIHCQKNKKLTEVRVLHHRDLDEINSRICGMIFEEEQGISLDH